MSSRFVNKTLLPCFLSISLVLCLIVNPAPAPLAAQQCSSLFEEALQASKNSEFVEALGLWDQLVELCPQDSYGWDNRGNVGLALQDFERAILDDKNSIELLPLALSNHALTNYQLGKLDKAESELRSIVLKYPMFADARAGLSALLWHKNSLGEAKSHWAAVFGLDRRYAQQNWLLGVRHWPPEPTKDLLEFLALEHV